MRLIISWLTIIIAIKYGMFSKTKKNNKREASPEPEMIEMEDLSGKPAKPEQVGSKSLMMQSTFPNPRAKLTWNTLS